MCVKHLHRRFFLGDHRILGNIQEKSPLDVTEYYLRDQQENNNQPQIFTYNYSS